MRHTAHGTQRSSAPVSPVGYSVFLSSTVIVISSDYYIVRKGYFSVPYLYTTDPDEPYWCLVGFNPKAYVPPLGTTFQRKIAHMFGIFINIVRLAGAIGRQIPIGATYIFRLNYFRSFMWRASPALFPSLQRMKWTEDGDGDVLEARLGCIPSDEEDGQLKLDEAEYAYDNGRL